MPSLKNNRATRLFFKLLKQGISPKKLALCAALGITLGVFPVYGATTLLCVIAASIFRLNQAAIQVINYAVFPLWFIMLVPFFKMGEYIFNASPIPLTEPKEIIIMFRSDAVYFFQTLGTAVFHAIVAWLLICPLIAVILYLGLLPLLKRHIR